MDRSDKVMLDRNEAARVAAQWGTFIARLLRPSVERDAHATATLVSRETHDFLRAVDTETGSAFLRGHAEDFAEALQEGLFGESFGRLLAENKTIAREEREKARRGKPKVLQPVQGQVAQGLDNGQRTITLRRRRADDV